MKKLFEKLFAVKVVADVQNINGRKSSGCEDYGGYQNWKATSGSNPTA